MVNRHAVGKLLPPTEWRSFLILDPTTKILPALPFVTADQIQKGGFARLMRFINPIQGRLKFPKIGQGGGLSEPPCTLCSI